MVYGGRMKSYVGNEEISVGNSETNGGIKR